MPKVKKALLRFFCLLIYPRPPHHFRSKARLLVIAFSEIDPGDVDMDFSMEHRALELAQYIAETKDTVRGAAKKFGISKSTVHKDVTVRLEGLNPDLYEEVQEVLAFNKEERHIRGGMATKEKYLVLQKARQH